ncbi:DUF2085 domain-containing protein [Paenibacillus sp. FJAT-26967]|uniref:DUF2085 domain-containing protein n=1 Tax=Paenibacillus sp. FJAT-26967 TaxID=1729690 RepID=UPI000A5E4D70|nr:DUF2085 domain-containing protein [Paenibacillus sp. FJAT-26967]
MIVVSKFLAAVPCHRMSSRSFRLRGVQLPLCARCMGILLGYLALPLFLLYRTEYEYKIGLLLCLPLLIDGFTQKWGWRTSSNMLRMVTGLMFGVGQCIVIAASVAILIRVLS